MARPRQFDPEETLVAIKNAFWLRGYEGASIQDLEAATGLKKQSLYRAFGDKRRMYLRALADYQATEVAEATRRLSSGETARERFEGYFGHVIDQALGKDDRRGCFICNASMDQAPLDEETRRAVRGMMAGVLSGFAAALAVSAPYDQDEARRLRKAAHLMAGHFGMRVMIKAGAAEKELRDAAAELIESI